MEWHKSNYWIWYAFEDKFYDKADGFALYPNIDNKFFTFSRAKKKIKDNQTDKDEKLIILYCSNIDEQHSYIEAAKEKGYEILLLDSPIVPHLIQKLNLNEKVSFVRVDGDSIENLIKDESSVSKLSEKEKEDLKPIIEKFIPKDKYTVQIDSLSSSLPFVLTQPEFMRRMKEMQQTGGLGQGCMEISWNV